MSAGAGTVLGGRYRLERLIAAGGMGEVWRGHDETLGRTVAVKVMHAALSANPGFLARFRAEARNTAALSHPGIATVYDYGEIPPDAASAITRAYLVMQLVEGEPLSAVLAGASALDPERTLDLVRQVAAALHVAHLAGVVHRDVKPANLLVRPDGSVVVTDFGIAHTADAAGALTATGEVLGTAAYLAPEQAEGKPSGPATDVYALGVVAYECLAGRRPFEGDTPVTVALAHLRQPPPPLPAEIPAPVRAVVERALAKAPGDRFPSAAAFADAARTAIGAAGAVFATVLPPTAPMSTVPPVAPVPVSPAPAGPAVGYATVRPLPLHQRLAGAAAAALRRPPTLVSGIAAGVVLALLFGVGATSMLLRSGTPATESIVRAAAPATPTTRTSAVAAAASPTPAAPKRTAPATLTLRRADYVGRPVTAARAKLKALGLRADEERQSGWRAEAGTVVGISPTRVQRGDTVTLVVSSGTARAKNERATKWKKSWDGDGDEQGDDE